ncbi:MAG: DNA repair protein RecN [Bacteroidales bacterium]|jgi:DNA repair protein RecN (Recombination protein N)|nr:DNA repair protein RecN [Bacteroidales bacterium]
MLQQLTVENYTLIRRLSINFNSGFTVITGETGAGKSILIGALSLILGQRADSNLLFDKTKKCIVEGLFLGKDYQLEPFFIDNDLDYDDQIILRREILTSGKSRAFINDTPVNLNVLRELGEFLVDIHSQHAILSLNDPAFQLNIVDEYAGNMKVLQEYRESYKSLQQMMNELEQLQQEELNAKKDQDYFQFLLTELIEARLNQNEKEELESELEIQTHAEEIKSNLQQIKYMMSEGDINLIGSISETMGILRKTAAYHKDLQLLFERFESIWFEMKDIDKEVFRLEGSLISDPERIEFLNRRLNLIYHLEQKHHVQGINELLQIARELEEKISGIVSLEGKIQGLHKSIENKKEQLNVLDSTMSKSRLSVLKAVSDELTELVSQLGMPDASVKLIAEKLSEPGNDGSDRIKILFNANRGGELKEVANIASGGELSRLMLSVKYLLSKNKKLPTLVFDEIDVGISGEIAAKMGTLMKNMSKFMQLLTITHLPQIAGKGDNHLLIYKETEDKFVRSNIKNLDYDQRIMEIAKMLSDENISEISVMKAKELIEFQS